MFELPSLWNLIVSTIVFIIAAWYLRRYLEAQGVPAGMARGLLGFVLAYVVSWGAGEMTDWVQEKIEGPRAAGQAPNELSQLLKSVTQPQP